jgi:hypothetical protein
LTNHPRIARATLVFPPEGVSVRSSTMGRWDGRLAMAVSRAAMVVCSPNELLKRIVVIARDVLTVSAVRSA